MSPCLGVEVIARGTTYGFESTSYAGCASETCRGKHRSISLYFRQLAPRARFTQSRLTLSPASSLPSRTSVSFTSFAFALLFTCVIAARLTIGRRSNEPAFLAMLGISSAVFYGWHVPQHLLIILASAAVDFYCAKRIHCSPDDAERKQYLLASVVVNLGMLAWFKYTNFAITEFRELCHAIGFDVPLRSLQLVLPMGISFYTFQSMSYTIDVYRRRLEPLQSFAKFFLYVSFFPQLVAGPIVRASEFIYQIDRKRRLHWLSFNQGVLLIIRGLFLKLVCADNIGAFVDYQWTPERNSTTLLLLAVLFSCQIFCDFAGYSSMARGLAYLLGFRFPVNFRNPYLANTFSNFWQRWHITLSQWLRDYLYVPLGGNRGTRRRTYINLSLVMLLGGLWHGASLTFIAWGALHGGMLALERYFEIGKRIRDGKTIERLLWFAIVQVTVLLSWIIFRSNSCVEAWQFLAGIAELDFGPLPPRAWWPIVCAMPVLLMHGRGWLAEYQPVLRCRPLEQALLAGCMLVCVGVAYGQSSEFIYFQF